MNVGEMMCLSVDCSFVLPVFIKNLFNRNLRQKKELLLLWVAAMAPCL